MRSNSWPIEEWGNSMKALVIEAPHRAVVQEVPYPSPGSGEITIRVERTGICGTDIHIFEGSYISPYPLIPGHEFSGTVHEVGEGVDGFAPGDRVSADPNLFCGSCEFCLTNRGNQCSRFEAIGVTLNGSMAEFVKVSARNALKLPEDMTFAEAAFIEPMACVVHAMNRLQLRAGSRVLLLGAGSMGQQLVQALSASGASVLCATDISERKLSMAMQLGATHSVLSSELDPSRMKKIAPHGFDVVVEATGIPAVIERAFSFMGPAATYLQFGVTDPQAKIPLSPFELFKRDWTLLGSMAINHTFVPAMHWLAAGRIQVQPLISDTIGLEEAAQFLAGPRDPDQYKVQIQP